MFSGSGATFCLHLASRSSISFVKLQPHPAPFISPPSLCQVTAPPCPVPQSSFPSAAPFPGPRLLGKVKPTGLGLFKWRNLPAAGCGAHLLFAPPFGSSSLPQHGRMEHDTTFALPQRKCFMGWHLATSAIGVFSCMTQTGSDSNGLVTPPLPRPSQHCLFSKWHLLQEVGGVGQWREWEREGCVSSIP